MTPRSRSIRALVSLAIFAVAVYGWSQRDGIRDWWRLRGYDPPAPIAALAADDRMTSKARRLFYLNQPRLLADVGAFRRQCPLDDGSIVLGCYHGGMGGIAIFAVHDPRLRGTEQVTAAHEMLHAAYERLSSGDRHEVDAQLVAFFKSGALDAEVRERIDSYEPSARVSEMHSMLGTEVADLPAGLEAYYGRYFDDRSAVTSFAAAYREQFQRLEGQIDTYEARLHTWSLQLETRSEGLDRQKQQLAVDRARLDSLRASSLVDEYNAAVPTFNAAVGDYNLAIADFHAHVDAYNDLVHQRNAIAQALGDLSRELDTRLAR